MKNPLRIYLADLTHTGTGVATEAFPLNIGLAAAYANKLFGRDIDITLFKYPKDLSSALQRKAPHILGCSNYAWNSHLSYHFVQMAKSISPEILTLFGGTNYPFDARSQEQFLQQHPALDLHLYYEGEAGFSSLLERVLSCERSSDTLQTALPGAQFIHAKENTFVSGQAVPRIKDLDAIPSPYASGLLDQFFDGKLTPLLETARGCPFTCNFCNAGADYFTKVNKFSDDYVREEWEYVARRSSKLGIAHLTLADNNFGMIPRDVKTAELMHELQDRFGWPRSVTAWTGKNSKEQVIDVTRILGDTLTISMAVQAMDETVLKNIKRQNIHLEDYRAIAQELNAQGRPQVAELIIPLPGDTWQTHVQGVRDLLDSHVSTVIVHTLQMLHGTPYKDDPDYIQEHQFIHKHRLVPLDFGQYDGKAVFDTEEVAVGTSTFSLEDYVASRKLLFVIDLCYNGATFGPLKRYLRSRGLKLSDWIFAIYDRIGLFNPAVQEIFDSFAQETLDELWNSEESLVDFYSDPTNYQKLVDGEMGGNLLFKHRAWMMTEASQAWLEEVFSATELFLQSEAAAENLLGTTDELKQIQKWIEATIQDAFVLEKAADCLEVTLTHDLLAWLQTPEPESLDSYRRATPILFEFSFDPSQTHLREDAINRYGANRHGMVKLMQRLAGTARLMRTVTYQENHVSRDDSPIRILG